MVKFRVTITVLVRSDVMLLTICPCTLCCDPPELQCNLHCIH